MTRDPLNMRLLSANRTGKYDFPPIARYNGEIPSELIPFNYAKSHPDRNVGVHFFIDDYQFERVWRFPDRYIPLLREYECVFTPDFSLYVNMPLTLKIYNVYRSRVLGHYWQENGIRIYVDLNVSSKFFEYNRMGVPDGWNAFATRGALGGLELLKAKFNQARQISGLDSPNLIVYGGGKEVHEFCCLHSLLYVHDYMTEKL